jgi:hypothetical protein
MGKTFSKPSSIPATNQKKSQILLKSLPIPTTAQQIFLFPIFSIPPELISTMMSFIDKPSEVPFAKTC